MNDGPSKFFKASRGLRRDDPISPMLFIIVMEALHKLLSRVRETSLFKGLSVGRGDGRMEITHLFFANDTLIFCESEKRALLNVRCVLLCFEAVPGLRIRSNLSWL